MNVDEKIVLIEIDMPIQLSQLINYESGIWRARISPECSGYVTAGYEDLNPILSYNFRRCFDDIIEDTSGNNNDAVAVSVDLVESDCGIVAELMSVDSCIAPSVEIITSLPFTIMMEFKIIQNIDDDTHIVFLKAGSGISIMLKGLVVCVTIGDNYYILDSIDDYNLWATISIYFTKNKLFWSVNNRSGETIITPFDLISGNIEAFGWFSGITNFNGYLSRIYIYSEFVSHINYLLWKNQTGGYYNDQRSDRPIIQSLRIDTEQFTFCNSLSEIRSQNQSFYYDRETTDIYINFLEWDYPLNKIIRPGAVTGYCSQVDLVRPDKSYYNGIEYSPRITKLPTLTGSKDPSFYGVIAFQTASIGLQNQDGFFDLFPDYDVYGQPVRIYIGYAGQEREEYMQVYSGYCDGFNSDYDEFTISIADPRKKLTRSLPVNEFSERQFSLLDSGDIGKPIPLIYGKVKKVPTTHIGGKYFVVCDGAYHPIKSITAYVNGIPTSHVGGTDGIIYIPTYDPEQSGEVSCTVEGYVDDNGDLIENGLDVILDLMRLFAFESYIRLNFNDIEWALERLSAPNIGIYISEKNDLIKIIEKICLSCSGIFMLQRDGRYTFRSYSSTRKPDRTIRRDEYIQNPKLDWSSDEFLSSVIVKYNRNFTPSDTEQEFEVVNNTDHEYDVVKRYKSWREKEFETILTCEDSAVAFSEKIMERSEIINPTMEIRTKAQNADLEIMLFVVASSTRNHLAAVWALWELISISVNLEKFETTMKLKYVNDYEMTETRITHGQVFSERLFGDYPVGATIYETIEEAA